MGKKITNWEQIFEQHQQSGKTIPEFCDDIDIHPNTFYNHRKKLVSRRNSDETSVVEIKPPISISTGPIVLKTKNYIISLSTGFDEIQLRSVLKIIGELE